MTSLPRALLGAFAGLLLASASSAQAPRITVSPAAPQPGSLVRLALHVPAEAEDSLASVSGAMAGEPLHFFRVAPGVWRAVGAVPVDANDSVRATAVVHRFHAPADTAYAIVTLPRPPAAPAPRRQLAVASRFTEPLDTATQARIERENARAREIGRRAHDSPPMWTAAFRNPRAGRITGRFGTGRVFNGRVTSRHLGVDFAGGPGAPVHAANRGVVALVDTFFLAGKVVYVNHGGGIVTGYFHLSDAIVHEGDIVERGQRIGSVGATGRVTGPHLHWSARYGALAVNPLDLVALGRWYGSGQ